MRFRKTYKKSKGYGRTKKRHSSKSKRTHRITRRGGISVNTVRGTTIMKPPNSSKNEFNKRDKRFKKKILDPLNKLIQLDELKLKLEELKKNNIMQIMKIMDKTDKTEEEINYLNQPTIKERIEQIKEFDTSRRYKNPNVILEKSDENNDV